MGPDDDNVSPRCAPQVKYPAREPEAARSDCPSAASRACERVNGVLSSQAEAATLSPSLLWTTSTAASYELKFLLGTADAERVQAWARQHLLLDPHADASLGDAYRIRSIYFDTERLDIFHQTPGYRRRKFRLRRYGSEHGVFLERKARSGDRVRKRRTLVSDQELGRLEQSAADPAWPGCWFHRPLLARQLKPRCVVGYERVAYVGVGSEGPLRLTLDRRICCAPAEGYDFEPAALAGNGETRGIPLLAENMVLELKFRASLPALFKHLLHDMVLKPTGVSKYRLGVQAWGLALPKK